MWRKALQISKLKKNYLQIIFILFLSLEAKSQSMEMPELQMPTMPSMPTIQSISSNNFYTPSLPTTPTIPVSPTVTQNEDNSTGEKKSETTISSSNANSDLMQSLLSSSTSSILTASDISSLYDSGLFSSLSGLDSSSLLQNYTTTTQTNLLLQQLLNSLNELKAQQNNADAGQKTAMENKESDAKIFKSREPKILRFKINGYDINSSLTQIFISEQESDGTFLLTADRKYYVNQAARNETFYMLFNAVSTRGNSLSYKVQTSLTQDYENENSFIYKMAQTNNLKADKTGNLVVLHYSENGFVIDLLLDLDNK